jgi:dCTP diphosphatase|tara:strand:- start:2960 stop:4195 length:1236 start_codon:yes stop_codon:yes gene_type:complete
VAKAIAKADAQTAEQCDTEDEATAAARQGLESLWKLAGEAGANPAVVDGAAPGPAAELRYVPGDATCASDTLTLAALQQRVARFAAERALSQPPRDAVLSLLAEVGGLCETFRQKGELSFGAGELTDPDRCDIAGELADVLMHLVLLAQSCNIDLSDEMKRKVLMMDTTSHAIDSAGQTRLAPAAEPTPPEAEADSLPECNAEDEPDARERRQRSLSSVTSAAAEPGGEAWLDAWRTRFECWWIALPRPTQASVGSCLAALSMHIGSRLSPSVGRPSAPEPGCEWIGEKLNLPEFPALGDDQIKFVVPPIPRLVPSWERLMQLQAAARRTAPSLHSPLQSPLHSSQRSVGADWVPYATGAGAGIGVVSGVLFVAALARLGRGKSQSRPSLRRSVRVKGREGQPERAEHAGV